MRSILLWSTLFSVAAAIAPAQEITLEAVQDTSLITNPFAIPSPEFGAGTSPFLLVGNRSCLEGLRQARTVLQFDLSSIPAGSRALMAGLELHVDPATGPVSTPINVTLHRLLADWGEGGSTSGDGCGSPPTLGDATWSQRFFGGPLWSTPGGDINRTPSASQELGDAGQYFWGPTDDMASDVQSWLDHPNRNFGWLMQSTTPISPAFRLLTSREGVNAAERPQLGVLYLPGGEFFADGFESGDATGWSTAVP